jgi:hypothetical protein
MKTIRLGLLSFAVCLMLGAAFVLLAPPKTQADTCNTNCTPEFVCGGSVGSCAPGSGYVPYNNCYPTWPAICEPESHPYNCCFFIGCGFPC